MAGRLHDRLAQTFGRDKLFMDVDHIPVGEDFVVHLNGQVAACDVVLVVIGPNWLGAKDESGDRRLDNPDDFVAIEIAAALARNIRVIPVLVDGARMPKESELPDSLKPLARRQAAGVRHAHFGHDADALIARMRKALGAEAAGLGRWRMRAAIGVAAIAVLLLIGWGGYGFFRHAVERGVQQAALKWEEERSAQMAGANSKVEAAERQRQAEAAVKAEQERQAKAAAEAEEKRKTEEQQRLAALRAEEHRRAKAAAEAEAKRKADEAERQRLVALRAEEDRKAKAAAEAEAKRKAEQAEQQRLVALRAEEDRKAKAAAEAEAKRKAEQAEQQRVLFTIRNNVEAVHNSPDETSFAQSIGNCEQKCAQRPTCNVFTYDKQRSRCYLYSRAEFARNNDYDSGEKRKADEAEGQRSPASAEDDRTVCVYALNGVKTGWELSPTWSNYVYEATRRGFTIGICKELAATRPTFTPPR